MFEDDKRVVLTLDAGGTNFVFSAIQGNREIAVPLSLPAPTNDLDACLQTLVEGFSRIKDSLHVEPVAISFAFPGPADYEHGVIGNLPNFPCFRGGVALKAYLEKIFELPVFINNDGNLFAYGEALSGVLPAINRELTKRGNPKRYKNLLGITFGTGFGAGVVIDSVLLTGDNGCGGDIWITRNKLYPAMLSEESVSIRGLIRVYNEVNGSSLTEITPKDLFDIAEGLKPGNPDAAKESFRQFGQVAGCSIAALLTFTDGIVVLGGGIVGAAKYILPALTKELNSGISTFKGDHLKCIQMEVYNLQDTAQVEAFYSNTTEYASVPGSEEKVAYDKTKKTALVVSSLGANRAIALGAYAFALYALDQMKTESDNK